MSRDDRIQREAAALWREVFGADPPGLDGGAALLDQALRASPEIRYDRWHDPRLRTVVRPR